MAEIVNLRIARKRRTSAKAELAAAANRVAFGISKDIRDRARRERSLADKHLEGRKLPESPNDD